MTTSKPSKKLKLGRCPSCKQKKVLGRCTFKGGGIDKIDHCRGCCDAPEVLKWKALPANSQARAITT